MTEKLKKQKCFEYFVVKMNEWSNEIPTNISMTKLRLHKLLFFVCAAYQSQDDMLFSVFNNFYAMQYGPVELDVYEMMNLSSFHLLSFDDRHLTTINEVPHGYFDDISLEQVCINQAIAHLKSINSDMIMYPSSRLVDISHRWSSWEVAISIATTLGESSEKMSVKLIQNGRRFFQ